MRGDKRTHAPLRPSRRAKNSHGHFGILRVETLEQHLQAIPNLSAVLSIEEGFFIARDGKGWMKGQWASLWGMLAYLHEVLTGLFAVQALSADYAADEGVMIVDVEGRSRTP